MRPPGELEQYLSTLRDVAGCGSDGIYGYNGLNGITTEWGDSEDPVTICTAADLTTITAKVGTPEGMGEPEPHVTTMVQLDDSGNLLEVLVGEIGNQRVAMGVETRLALIAAVALRASTASSRGSES